MQMLTLLPDERHGPVRAQLEAVIADARREIRSPIELAAFERMLTEEGLRL